VSHFGHQCLRPPEHTGGLTAVVQPADGEQVPEEHGVAQDGAYRRIGSTRLFVAGRGERQFL